MSICRSVVPAAVLVATVPVVLGAQTVRGTVVDNADRAVSGVVVLLLDSASREAARVLTNDQGEYRLTARRPGTYRIRTLRIGFGPVMTEPMLIQAGDAVVRRLVLGNTVFLLDTVRAVGRNACRVVAADSTSVVSALWDQVRGALIATQLTLDTRSLQTTTLGYDRTMDPRSRRIGEQHVDVRADFARQPWRSLPVDSLRRVGYVYTAAGDIRTYNAPGLDVLLSDEFLEDHCLRISRGSDEARLGIDFEPTGERKAITGIRGTVWLDRASSELREMEYRYVNNISRDEERIAGGTIGFTRMRNGMWVISRWNIQMPTLVLAPVYGRRLQAVAYEARVDSVKVTGGELVMALLSSSRGRDTIWSRPTVALRGAVLDSLSGRPIPGAVVAVGGTAQVDSTDSTGRFEIPGMLPGRYSVDVRTPSLDSVNTIHQQTLLFADTTVSLAIRVPDASMITAGVCGLAGPIANGSRAGFVLGTVTRDRDTTPAANARVFVEWKEIGIGTRGGRPDVADHRRVADARTDARGSFRMCGLPINTPLTFIAMTDSGESNPVPVKIPNGQRFARADLALDQVGSTSSFIGVVVDSAHAGLPEVEVSLPDLGLSTRTDGKGGFFIRGLIPGTHRVVVRRLGFGPLESTLDFRAGVPTEHRIELSRITVLDPVVREEQMLWREAPLLREFADNRRIGLGKFFTRDDLELARGRSMMSFFESIGFSTITLDGGRWIKAMRGQRSFNDTCYQLEDHFGPMPKYFNCGCFPLVFLDGQLLSVNETVPNINRFRPDDLEAMEVYRSAAQTPQRYSALNSHCGVIVLHSRRPPGKKDTVTGPSEG